MQENVEAIKSRIQIWVLHLKVLKEIIILSLIRRILNYNEWIIHFTCLGKKMKIIIIIIIIRKMQLILF